MPPGVSMVTPTWPGQLGRQRAGEADHAELRGAVGGGVGHGPVAQRGGDRHDMAVRGHQMRAARPAPRRRSQQVHRHDPLPVGRRHVHQRPGWSMPAQVTMASSPPAADGHPFDGGGRRRPVGQVDHLVVGIGGAEVEGHGGGALLAQGGDDGGAEASGPAGHDHGAVCDVHVALLGRDGDDGWEDGDGRALARARPGVGRRPPGRAGRGPSRPEPGQWRSVGGPRPARHRRCGRRGRCRRAAAGPGPARAPASVVSRPLRPCSSTVGSSVVANPTTGMPSMSASHRARPSDV